MYGMNMINQSRTQSTIEEGYSFACRRPGSFTSKRTITTYLNDCLDITYSPLTMQPAGLCVLSYPQATLCSSSCEQWQ